MTDNERAQSAEGASNSEMGRPRLEKLPRVEPCRVTGAMGHLWSTPTKNGVRECLFCCERRVMAGPTVRMSDDAT